MRQVGGSRNDLGALLPYYCFSFIQRSCEYKKNFPFLVNVCL